MDKLLVKGFKYSSTEPLPLSSLLKDSFYIQWELNGNYQMQFTAYDDGSLAFRLLDAESSCYFGGQEFIIKQCIPDFVNGVATKQIVATHTYSEINRIRQNNTNSGVKSYSPNDVLNYYLSNNHFGFTWEVQGDFSNKQSENLGNGNGKDCLNKILELWPDAIIFPNNRHIIIYDSNHFYKNYNNRLDYRNNSSEIKLTYDSTNIINQVLCISGTHDVTTTKVIPGQTHTTTQVVKNDGADKVKNDARKYLGVPYVWGGHNKANPYGGMDCSGFVSQVYYDFGINIPAYTVAMERYGHQVDNIQTGDMLMYGSHGATYHCALALTDKTMIFEPQPGQVCKEEPIKYFPPSFVLRNSQMDAIVNGTSTITSTYKDPDTTETETKTVKWFDDFTCQDDNSINKWGVHPGAPISNDSIHDANTMKSYALSQLQPEPNLTIEVTINNNEKPIAGEIRRLNIKENGFSTDVTVVAYQWYPLSKVNATTITLNNTAQTILNYQSNHATVINEKLNEIKDFNQQILDHINNGNLNTQYSWSESEMNQFESNINRN